MNLFMSKCHIVGNLMSGLIQGTHRLGKVLDLEGLLEKPLKTKSALKSTEKSLKNLEKSLNSTISVGLSIVDRDLNLYTILY